MAQHVQSNNSYGNVVEALIGALFIDGGYDAAHTFVVHLLEDFIKIDRLLIKEENYKSTLIEICQKQRWSYRFELIEQQRLEQNRMRFQTRVYVDDIDCGSGVGNSKRVSEQNAAKHALPILRKKSLKPAR